MIAVARIRQDVLAYKVVPQDEDDAAFARISQDWSNLADKTDWDALYEGD
jgi:hypothetical protein